MSLFRRFFVGAGYSLLGASVHRVLLAIAAIVTARLLGVKEYGVYANLIAVVNLLMTFGLFGVHTAFSSFLPGAASPERARQIVSPAPSWCASCSRPSSAGLGQRLVRGRRALPVRPHRGPAPGRPAVSRRADAQHAAALGPLRFQEFRRYSLSLMQLGALVAMGSVIGVLSGGLRGLLLGGTAAYALSTLFVAFTLGRLLGARATLSWPECAPAPGSCCASRSLPSSPACSSLRPTGSATC